MKNLLINLKQRGGMFLFDDKYMTLVSYIIGYDHAMRECGNQHFSELFQDWLRNRERSHFSLHWSMYILNEMAGKDDEKAKVKLFDMFDEFFAEHIAS